MTVRPQVDGKILTINFKEGQEVKQGDVLAKIDPVTYKAQLDQAIAKKALDEAQLANAKRDLERYSSTSANVVVAQKTIDTQRALVAQLDGADQVGRRRHRERQGHARLTDIAAPIDGRTGIRMVDVGNLVRAADAGIVVITEVQPISVLFTLPQQELAAHQRGAVARARVKVEALDTDGKNVLDTGELQVVDNQVDQTTGTMRLKAEFPNTDLQLWPGQFVNVRLLIDTLKQVVVVPTPAVQRGPNGTFVYVVGATTRSPCARRRRAAGREPRRHLQRRADSEMRRDHGLCAPQGWRRASRWPDPSDPMPRSRARRQTEPDAGRPSPADGQHVKRRTQRACGLPRRLRKRESAQAQAR